MARPNSSQAALYALALVGTAIALLAFFAAPQLRPIADDYCWAGVAAQDGLVGAVGTWFETWSGDLTAIALNTLLVGAPLIYLPWGMASAAPFVLAALSAVALAGVCLSTGLKFRMPGYLAIGASLVVAWFGYWWIPMWLGANEYFGLSGYYVTFWQNINSGYVVLPGVAVLVWVLLSSRSARWPMWVSFTSWAGLGLIVGLGGYPLALALVVTTAVPYGIRLLRRTDRIWSARTAVRIAFIVSIAIGASISLSSPGAQARAAQLAVSPSISDVASSATQHAGSAWLAGLLNFGALASLLIAVPAGWLAARAGVTLNTTPVLRWSGQILFLSVVLAVATGAAEAFAYPAPWHFVSSYTLIWTGLSVLGLGLGVWLAEAETPIPAALYLGLLIAALAGTTVGVLHARGEIENRLAAWNLGPAPVAGMMDIYTPAYYTTSCWYEIGRARTLPPRPFALPRVGDPGSG